MTVCALSLSLWYTGDRVNKKEFFTEWCVWRVCACIRMGVHPRTCADSVTVVVCILEPSASFLQTKFGDGAAARFQACRTLVEQPTRREHTFVLERMPNGLHIL